MDPPFYRGIVLDRKCVECHRQQKAVPLTAAAGDDAERRDWPADFAKSFDQLSKRGWSPAFVALEKKWGWSPGGSRSTPGQVGARAWGLWKLLEKGHHDVQLTADERRRIALWLDTGSNFYGTYDELETQARGEPVRPELE